MSKGVDSQKGNGSTRFLVFLVGLLLVAVGVQSFFLARLYRADGAASAPTAEAVPVTARADAAPDAQLQIIPKDANPPARTPPPVRPALPPPTLPTQDLLDSFFGSTGTSGFDPFEEMQAMRERMDRMMDGMFAHTRSAPGLRSRFGSAGFMPQLDLADDGKNYVIRFDIPGAEETDISVDLQDRTLTVSGDTSEEIEESEGGQSIRIERRTGQFRRSIMLPGPVDAEKMNADYDDGVLTVTIPKLQQIPAKRSMTI